MTSCSPPRPRLIAIGGCHRDIVARSSRALQPASSCPGVVVDRMGGVARNVAVLVAGADLAVRFVGRVGADPAGDDAVADMARAGVDASGLRRDPQAATGRYVAIHDADGELVAAVSDLGIYDRIGEADVAGVDIGTGDRVFADANLPAVTLAALAARCGSVLAVDAISPAKIARVVAAAAAGALLFANTVSVAALAGSRLQSAPDAARHLAERGVVTAVVTAGAQPVAILQRGAVTTVPVPAVPVVDVTGAGDALTAATLTALARGADLPSAVALGIRAAAAALAHRGALSAFPGDLRAALSALPRGIAR